MLGVNTYSFRMHSNLTCYQLKIDTYTYAYVCVYIHRYTVHISLCIYTIICGNHKAKTYRRHTKDNKKETLTYHYRKLTNHKRRVQEKKKATERNYKTANN